MPLDMVWLKHRKMSARQYQQALHTLGLTQVKAGEFLGVSHRTARRYISGETEVPVSTALLLRHLIKEGATSGDFT